MQQRQKQTFPFFEYKNDLQKEAQLVQQGNFSSQVLGVNETVSLSIDKLCEYIEKQYPCEKEIYLQKTVEVLANYMNKKDVKVKNVVSIEECIRMNLIFSFTSKLEMAEFVRLTFQSHLWSAIQYDYIIPEYTISLHVIQLPKLKEYIQNIKNQRNSQQTLLEDNSLYRTREYSENCQSKHQLIMNKRTTENKDDFSFEKINQTLRKQDIFALKTIWDCQLRDTLDDICKNWEVYSRFLHKEIETFIMLNMYKMFKINSVYKNNKQKMDYLGPKNDGTINIYEQIYPKMSYFISFFSRKMGIVSIQEFLRQKIVKGKYNKKYRSLYKEDEQAKLNQQQTAKLKQSYLQIIRKQLNIQQNMADKMLYYFLREQTQNQQKKRLNFSVMVDQQMPMKQYISNCQDFYLNSTHWGDIFNSFSHQFFKQKNNNYFSHIEKERLVQSQCLGCSKFFVLGQNIYDCIINQCPIKVFPSIRKLKEMEATLKDQICGMLNNGGGIILFNCTQQYRQIYPSGIRMSQKNKQQCQQRLYSYINQFYPKLEVKTHVYISFVPVISLKDVDYDEDLKMNKYAGEEGILKDNYSFIQRDYFEGHFVTRVRIVPADPSLVYYWYKIPQSASQPIRKYCQVNNNNGIVSKLNTRAMCKLIKKKMNHFYVKEAIIDNQERNLLKLPSINIQHQCRQPQIGIITGGFFKEAKRADNILNLEDKYTYLSLLVTKGDNNEKIKQKIGRSRLNCELKVLFSEQKFKTAQNTIALYHNNKFEQVLIEINSHSSYVFDARPVLIINVTSFLKLEKRNQNNSFTIDDFNYISNLFSRKYPNQSLKLYQFKATLAKKQYYILTQSKVSNLYMYYLINQKKEKAVFKNPYLLDKLSPAEREQRMILQFERKGRNQIFSQSNRKSAKLNQSHSINLSKHKNMQSFLWSKQQKDFNLIKTASSGQPFEMKLDRIIHVEKHLSQTQLNESDESQSEHLYENWKAEFELQNYLILMNNKSLNSKIYEYQS